MSLHRSDCERCGGPCKCGFCHGGPVGNAATWVDGKARPPAACPRCGLTNIDQVAAVSNEQTPLENAIDRADIEKDEAA